MSVSDRYVLDANVFIEAKNKYYGFDICPGFWTSLVGLNRSNRVFSIDRVRRELIQQNDQIGDWIKERAPETFFKKTEDQAVIDTYQQMMRWVFAEIQFTEPAKNDFASGADGWVLAYAKVNGLIIVTHEEYAPNAKRKVPMPNVCVEFELDDVNTFEMLRNLRVKFVRSTKRGRKGS